MSKKSPDLKKYNYANLSNLYGPPLCVSIDKDYLDSYAASHTEVAKSNNKKGISNYFKNIQKKLFGKTSNLTPEDEQVQTKLDTITCHVCGLARKQDDFFCSECGSKLRVGHYDD